MLLRLVLVLAVACSSASPRVERLPARTADAGIVAIDAATRAAARLAPPVAAKRPHEVKSPHGTRIDPYYWLRDDTRSNPEVLAYLQAEADYATAMLAPARALEDAIVRETRARIDEDDSDAPLFEDGYWYYTRYATGQQQPIYARRKGTMSAPEEILLDGNVLGKDKAFYAVGDFEVTRDGIWLAWTEDSVGRNQFTLHVKNLATGEQLPQLAAGVAPSVVWANDNKTVFYVGKDPTTLREDRVMRHTIRSTAHELVYQERDAAYYVDVGITKSHKYITVQLDATTMSETRLVDADKPASAPRVFIPRSEDHAYEVEHVGKRFIVRSNDGADNYRIVEVPAATPAKRATWKTRVAHRSDVLVEDYAVYDSFIAINVRSKGLSRIEIVPTTGKRFTLDGSDPAFAMTLLDTPDPAATRVRYDYDSLTQPTVTYELDVVTSTRTLLHQDPAPTYDASRYTSEYVHATAPDGTKVPISVVYRNDTKRDGTAPILITGYGAYGTSMEPTFERARVSLLDRGWVFAIAHVRGGQELGDAWYEAGRFDRKLNTFTDFIAVTEQLVASRYAARDRVFAEGASAGGLLVGAIANMRPDLYRGLVAWVPFVDAVTTMLDESIPLVTNEYEEWGNPSADKAAYDYILAYSPYDNVKPQRYPAMYVRTGLHDSQVQYFEPAKWVAKLRATKTDDNLLLFETDMTAGHGGKSGRFDALREWARAYAFMLMVNGDGDATR